MFDYDDTDTSYRSIFDNNDLSTATPPIKYKTVDSRNRKERRDEKFKRGKYRKKINKYDISKSKN
jgi:hypothetical protein